jgi:hypothetical protein
MSIEQSKIFNMAKKLLCHSAILALIVIPAIMITIPGCNLFFKCGKPGYQVTNTSCSSYTVRWSCSDGCSPTITQKSYNFTTTNPDKTDTVYCEQSNYETSDGIYLTISGC